MIYFTTVYEDEITHQIMLKIFSRFSGYFAESISIPCNGYGKIKKNIREGIVPVDNYSSIGPGYNVEFQRFIQHHWDIDVARNNSTSLHKTMSALEKIGQPYA